MEFRRRDRVRQILGKASQLLILLLINTAGENIGHRNNNFLLQSIQLLWIIRQTLRRRRIHCSNSKLKKKIRYNSSTNKRSRFYPLKTNWLIPLIFAPAPNKVINQRVRTLMRMMNRKYLKGRRMTSTHRRNKERSRSLQSVYSIQISTTTGRITRLRRNMS